MSAAMLCPGPATPASETKAKGKISGDDEDEPGASSTFRLPDTIEDLKHGDRSTQFPQKKGRGLRDSKIPFFPTYQLIFSLLASGISKEKGEN